MRFHRTHFSPEAIKHPDAEVPSARVLGVQLPEHVDLELGRLAVLVNVLDYL
jgi:hypothetical protein